MHLQFIVVFGTRWTFRPVSGGWDGKLNCPDCGTPERMIEMDAVKAFTLYWIPLWRSEYGGRVVECQTCQTKFELPDELKAPTGRPLTPAAQQG